MDRRTLLTQGLALGGSWAAREAAWAAEGQEAGQKSLVIDAHCHAGKGEAMLHPWSTFADPEVVLRRAAEAGIDQSIIFPVLNPEYEKANEEIARLVSKHPDKFIGFARHDPKAEAGKIKKLLTREVKELGLKGLKLRQLPTREVMDAVAELGLPILIHPDRVEDCRGFIADYPKVNVIIAHLGSFASASYQEHTRAIEIVRTHANAYLETSAVVFFDYLEQAGRQLPAEKLVFGSDSPMVDARVELYKIRLLKLSKEKEALVLSGNIRRLLRA